MGDEHRESDEAKLDETLEETFPASDSPANTVETGIRTGEPPASTERVSDNRQRNRFEVTVNGYTAFLAYERTDQTLTLVHTEVPPELRGRNLGNVLVEAALRGARIAGLRIVALCPFVRSYLRRHPA